MTASTSPGSDQVFLDLLERARNGEHEALGQLIDLCRPYLAKIACDERDAKLQAKVGNSDLVQSTCFEAVRDFAKFRGQSSREMLRWLRQILLRRLGAVRDRYYAAKRDVGAEIPLQPDGDDRLKAPQAPPGEKMVRDEERALLEQALDDLPPLERMIIELRQKDGQAFAEIARRLDLTEEAARKRWFRAVQALQERLCRLHDSPPS